MFKRLKRIIELSKKDPKVLDKLTDEDLAYIPEIGDGNAVFFSEGSEEEWAEEEHKKKFGVKKLFGLE